MEEIEEYPMICEECGFKPEPMDDDKYQVDGFRVYSPKCPECGGSVVPRFKEDKE